MSNPYYIGTSPEDSLGNSPRFFYAIRRNNDGELFFLRSDQLRDKSSITLNNPGDIAENFEDFEPGIDYFEGITDQHEPIDENLNYPQYRWDNRSVLYYIDSEGQLVERINFNYDYPDGISSNG